MREIFLVLGDSGEYEEHTEWIVAAYPTEPLAVLHVERATRAAVLVNSEIRDYFDGDKEGDMPHPINHFDPSDEGSRMGARYRVHRVPFLSKVPRNRRPGGAS